MTVTAGDDCVCTGERRRRVCVVYTRARIRGTREANFIWVLQQQQQTCVFLLLYSYPVCSVAYSRNGRFKKKKKRVSFHVFSSYIHIFFYGWEPFSPRWSLKIRQWDGVCRRKRRERSNRVPGPNRVLNIVVPGGVYIYFWHCNNFFNHTRTNIIVIIKKSKLHQIF